MEVKGQELNRARYWNYAKVRDEKSMTDAQVAREAGILPTTISDWKAGRSTPAFGNIIKIANVLGVAANVFELEGI